MVVNDVTVLGVFCSAVKVTFGNGLSVDMVFVDNSAFVVNESVICVVSSPVDILSGSVVTSVFEGEDIVVSVTADVIVGQGSVVADSDVEVQFDSVSFFSECVIVNVVYSVVIVVSLVDIASTIIGK